MCRAGGGYRGERRERNLITPLFQKKKKNYFPFVWYFNPILKSSRRRKVSLEYLGHVVNYGNVYWKWILIYHNHAHTHTQNDPYRFDDLLYFSTEGILDFPLFWGDFWSPSHDFPLQSISINITLLKKKSSCREWRNAAVR